MELHLVVSNCTILTGIYLLHRVPSGGFPLNYADMTTNEIGTCESTGCGSSWGWGVLGYWGSGCMGWDGRKG